MRSLRTWSLSRFCRTAWFAILLVSIAAAQSGKIFANPWRQSDEPFRLLICTPSSLQFGNVAVGREKLDSVTITNTRESSVVISGATTLGQDFGARGLELPLTLGPGESYTFKAVFAPHFIGETHGSILLTGERSDGVIQVLQLGMTGIGEDAGKLLVGPPWMNFGARWVGTHSSLVGTITALGSAVTIYSAEISNSEFELGGLSFPVTVSAGETQEYTVTFEPRFAGPVGAQILLYSDGENSPAVQFLTGMGIGTQPHSVDLMWDPSRSHDVVGYNVYRSNTDGGPYTRINQVPDPHTAYTDNSVIGGATYYYVSTAVSENGQESAFSQEVQVRIPLDP
jgi:hypothetical protein